MMGEVEGPAGYVECYLCTSQNLGVREEGGISNENLFVQATVIHTLIALCA